MERPWKYLAAATFAASVVGLGVSPATAVQNFTDEAGQLLYSIDDNGIVSMFENSPGTDVTLSVTRGTRDQMQPQVTEVIPEAVPAGSFNVLKLRGKKLLGATGKLRVPDNQGESETGKPKTHNVTLQGPLALP